MRVLQFINTLSTSDGGPARNSFELNLALNAIEDTRVDLIWMRGDLADSIVFESSERIPSPGPRRLGWRSHPTDRQIGLSTLLRDFRQVDAVLIHGYYLPWVPVIALVCTLANVKFVITPHGSLTRHQRDVGVQKKRVFETLFGRFVRRSSSGFVTGSQTEADELKEAFPRSSVRVGGVGTRLSVSTERRHNDHGAGVRLLSVARIAPKKRVDLMIDAVAALSALGRRPSLTVAGSGDETLLRKLKHQAEQLGVEDLVLFAGMVRGPAKERLFAESDIFLLPSDDENFGIGLAEALAHGVPSVVSDRVAAAASMSPTSGRTLTSPTGGSIAEAVVQLLDMDYERARVSARADAAAKFSWEAIATIWRGHLESISR